MEAGERVLPGRQKIRCFSQNQFEHELNAAFLCNSERLSEVRKQPPNPLINHDLFSKHFLWEPTAQGA